MINKFLHLFLLPAISCALVQLGCAEKTTSTGSQHKREDVATFTPRQKIDTTRVLATVNGIALYPEDLVQFVQNGCEATTKQEALNELIAFTLMADAARTKGYGRHPAVAVEYKKALALELLKKKGTAFTQESIPMEVLTSAYQRQLPRFVHGRRRSVVHALARTGKAYYSPDEALSMASKIHASAKQAQTEAEFRDAVKQAAGNRPVTVEALPPFDAKSKGFVAPFVDGAFSVPFKRERVSTPVKTQFGYHVIFVLSEDDAVNVSFKDALATLRTELFAREQKKYISDLIDRLYKNGDVFLYDEAITEIPIEGVY